MYNHRPEDTVGAYRSPCEEQATARWYEEQDNLINRLENWRLAHADQLDKQLVRQENTLRIVVSEQLGPLLYKVQALIDSIGRSQQHEIPRNHSCESLATACAQPQVDDSACEQVLIDSTGRDSRSSSAATLLAQPSVSDNGDEDVSHKPGLSRQHSSVSLCFHSEHVCSEVNAEMQKIKKTLSQRVSASMQKSAVLCKINGSNGCLVSIAESPCVTGFITVAVILNSLFIGAQVHENFKRLSKPTAEEPPLFKYVNQAFACIFVTELSLRLIAHKLRFFTGEDWRWNVFDAMLGCTSAIDVLLERGVNLSASRIFRVFRMARVLRIIRVVESFHELREMLCSILGSLKSLCWAITLLGIIMYLFAVVFMQGAIACVEHNGARPEEFAAYFGSVPSTMYSLLLAITGGRDWGDMAVPFDRYSKWFRLYFTIYILLVVVGVLNILTGIFVSRAAQVSARDKDLILQAETNNTRHVVRDLHRMFQEMGAENSGTIHIDQLKEYIQHQDVQAYLSVLNLDYVDCHRIISLLHQKRDGMVSMQEFIACCLRYKGHARNVEVAVILRQQKKQSDRLCDLAEKSEDFMRAISEKIQRVLDRNT